LASMQHYKVCRSRVNALISVVNNIQ